MLKLLATLLLSSIGFTPLAIATTDNQNTKPITTAQNQDQNTEVLLYEEPNTNKVIQKLSPDIFENELIPIYKKGDWIKVGISSNGQVGWINTRQYDEARENYYRPDIQTVFIQKKSDEKGKPSVNIVAYKNGKPLSQPEAAKLYQKLRDDQENQLENMRKTSRDFFDMEPFYWVESPRYEPSNKLPPTDQDNQTQENQKAEQPAKK